MKTAIRIGLLLLVIVLTGCASFKSPMNGKYVEEYEKNTNAEKVNILFIYSHYSQTLGYDAIPKLTSSPSDFNDIFRDALSEISNIDIYNSWTIDKQLVNDSRKRSISKIKKEHDYIIEIKFKREKSFVKFFFGTIASSISATIIPIRYKYKYLVDVNVYNYKQQLIQSYTRDTDLNKWVQTFMVFIYPFHHTKRKREVLYVEFMHDIFRQIESEKILDYNTTEKQSRTIYSSSGICNFIENTAPDDEISWKKQSINEWLKNEDMAIVIHIPGDELNEEMAKNAFKMKVERLDEKTEEEGILFWVDKEAKNPLLLISAKNETVLKTQLHINKQLMVLLNGMFYMQRE